MASTATEPLRTRVLGVPVSVCPDVFAAALALRQRSGGQIVTLNAEMTMAAKADPALGAAIAAAAAQLVEPGATIGISAGTTTFEFARAIRNVPHLTVVTNSVPVAQLLHESHGAGHVVVLTGGVRTPSDALVGPVAVTALRGLHVDRLFLGAHGVDRNAGLTTPNLVEAQTNRALVRSSSGWR